MRCVGVIPARYSSTRFPGKPLALIKDKPMIQWVYTAASEATHLDHVLVATDDERIFEAVRDFGGLAQMTSAGHQSGTDRIAEVAEDLDAELIVNIQGDEPLIEPHIIDTAVAPLIDNPDIEMGTLACPFPADTDPSDPDIVKVVFDRAGNALYFSRHPIPYRRGGTHPDVRSWQHIGLYVYRRSFLLKFARSAPTSLEKAESLEQLRALELGYQIHVEQTEFQSAGVDRPEDLEKILQTIEAASMNL